MCGRIVQITSPEEIAREFGAPLDPALSGGSVSDTRVVRAVWQPRWNLAPSLPALVVRGRVEMAMWGMSARWQTARTGGLFNARAETVEKLPSFRDAYRKGRLVVPIDAFYEWENPEHLAELGRPLPKRAPKQPWAFLPAAGGRFALAAIGADRPDGAFGFSLITTQANGVVGRIHDRMPVILPNGDAIGTWLDPDAHRDDLAELLGPLPDERVATRRVSRRVSNARNEGPECLVEAPVEGLGLL